MANDTKLYSYNFSSQLNQIDFFSVSAPAFIMGRNWTFALSYYRYIPYGLKGSAQEVLTFLRDRFDPQIDTVAFTGSEGIDVLAFSASAALTDHFALGATLQQFFDSGSRHLTTEISNREYHSQFSEKLQGRNFIAGLLFSPFSFLRLGFTWHSGLKNNFDSTLLTWEVNRKGDKLNPQEVSCQARVVIPEQVCPGHPAAAGRLAGPAASSFPAWTGKRGASKIIMISKWFCLSRKKTTGTKNRKISATCVSAPRPGCRCAAGCCTCAAAGRPTTSSTPMPTTRPS